jgi:hypothetical protein
MLFGISETIILNSEEWAIQIFVKINSKNKLFLEFTVCRQVLYTFIPIMTGILCKNQVVDLGVFVDKK